MKNKVQLIGNVAIVPTFKTTKKGKKLARILMFTIEYYTNSNGKKVDETEWHTVVAWGKMADKVESYVKKGEQIGVSGKLKSRSLIDKDGIKRYVTEVEANEIVLLSSRNSNSNTR
ncbi:single-stranded DNA-binding protein [Tenacibaculum holothuriorum]|nr:single-stranded DNA-binding protein [Tenacibaculum holothuriorum]